MHGRVGARVSRWGRRAALAALVLAGGAGCATNAPTVTYHVPAFDLTVAPVAEITEEYLAHGGLLAGAPCAYGFTLKQARHLWVMQDADGLPDAEVFRHEWRHLVGEDEGLDAVALALDAEAWER